MNFNERIQAEDFDFGSSVVLTGKLNIGETKLETEGEKSIQDGLDSDEELRSELESISDRPLSRHDLSQD